MNSEREKLIAAEKSLEFVEDGMVLGLGSGSTAAKMIELLGRRVRDGLKVSGVPTSEGTRQLAHDVGIPLTSFDDVLELDLTIDGADEADRQLNLIKGGGGALLREKIVANASRQVIIIADSSKLVPTLGAFPLPVEVVPFAWRLVVDRLERRGVKARLRITSFHQPFVTDEGNYILDCEFGTIADPEALANDFEVMPDVVEHGLFVGMVDKLIVGRDGAVELFEKSGTQQSA